MRRSRDYRYLNERRRSPWVHLLWAVVLAVVFWLIGDRLLAPTMHRISGPASKPAKPVHEIDVVVRELPRQSQPLTLRPRPQPQPANTQTPADREDTHPRETFSSPQVEPPVPTRPQPVQETARPKPKENSAARPTNAAKKPVPAIPNNAAAPAPHVRPKPQAPRSADRQERDAARKPAAAAVSKPNVSTPVAKPPRQKPATDKPVSPKPVTPKPPAVQPSDSLDEISHSTGSSGTLRIRLAKRYPNRDLAEQAAARVRAVASAVAVVADDKRPGMYRVQLATYAQRENARQFVSSLARHGVTDPLSIE